MKSSCLRLAGGTGGELESKLGKALVGVAGFVVSFVLPLIFFFSACAPLCTQFKPSAEQQAEASCANIAATGGNSNDPS
jgi:hypothetical protein